MDLLNLYPIIVIVVVRKRIFSWTVSTRALASRDLSHTHLVTNLLYISDCLQIPGHACNKVLIELCTLMKHKICLREATLVVNWSGPTQASIPQTAFGRRVFRRADHGPRSTFHIHVISKVEPGNCFLSCRACMR